MNTVHINTSKPYDVIIGSQIMNRLGEEAAKLKSPGKAAIISDSNVWPIYGVAAAESLIDAGFDVVYYVFPAGEASKTPNTYLEILNLLADNQITRSDILVALGGGVVGDMAGFVAATFLRGITYIQVPTSLLAMVDSSVGGKTAIDLPAGKNLVGAFYQPGLVLCAPDALATLPDEVFIDGCAEVIKYGVLFDSELFRHLSENATLFNREYVITRCVELKRDVVIKDEFDTGERMKLNLGHTVGHGIEACSSFSISHGRAVAIGMAVVARASQWYRICKQNTTDQILTVLEKFGLPSSTAFSSEQLYNAALSDKKRMGGTVNLIVPLEIGMCDILKMPIGELEKFMKAGL